MTRILLLFICHILACLLISCEKPENPFSQVDVLAEFVGHWDLLNSNSPELEQLIILKKESGRVSIQLWGECLPDRCEWGIRTFHQAELEEGPLTMYWTGEDVKIVQVLTLLESGKLEIRSTEDHVNDDWDTEKVYLFTKNEKLKLFDQVSLREALRISLSREKLNGSQGEENQLLPNSIILYQTTAGRFGKMQIRGNADILTFRWKSWEEDGSIYREVDYMETRSNAFYDLNIGREIAETDDCISDFLLEETEPNKRWISPQCGAVFVLYHVGS